LIDVYGEQGVTLGRDGEYVGQEVGIGGTPWLLNVEEHRAENHYAAIGKFRGPAAEQAERERIARLKASRGK